MTRTQYENAYLESVNRKLRGILESLQDILDKPQDTDCDDCEGMRDVPNMRTEPIDGVARTLRPMPVAH